MTFPGNDAPVFLITAGPNGSGKSSAYEDTKIEWEGRTIWIINPDLLTRRIEDVEALVPPASNIEAVKRIERWLDLSIDVHKSIGVETVLSTPSIGVWSIERENVVLPFGGSMSFSTLRSEMLRG